MKRLLFGVPIVLASCGGATPTPRAEPIIPEDPRVAVYPILTESEIEGRTHEASASGPGWTLTLDSLGFLSMAFCDVCETTRPFGPEPGVHADDYARVAAFLGAEEDVVHFTAPFVERQLHNENGGVLFEQRSFGSMIGFVSLDRSGGRVAVFGHAWPRLPTTEGVKPDAELEGLLRFVQPSPNAELRHRVLPILRNPAGPVELHAAVCLHFTGSVVGPATDGKEPCVDAFTGESIGDLVASIRVTTGPSGVTRTIVVMKD